MAEWISVEDRLPEPYEPWVVVRALSRHGHRYEIMEGAPGKGYWFDMDYDIIHVTHWMPLPLPPKES